MPTRKRLPLLFACLLLGPLVVIAAELPDTNTIESLTVEQAWKLVAKFQGIEGEHLLLSGLNTLDAATLKMLDKFGHPLQLDGITAFESRDSVAIAHALAALNSPLSLPNLKKISPKTLSALIEKLDITIPLIETLELIPEPDGSVTEDFVIPEGFEQR